MANRLNRTKTVLAARRAEKKRNRDRNSGRSDLRLASTRHKREAAESSPVAPAARRVRQVAVAFGVVAAILMAQAARLQLFEHERFAAIAERQARSTARVQANRGAIRDRGGAELAITVDVDSVYYEWVQGRRPATAAEVAELSEILRRPPVEVQRRLASQRRFTYLARRVDAATAARVRSLGVPGVGTKREPKRFYTNVHLAAHILGFTNIEGEGRAGIERRFDERLQGRQGTVNAQRDAVGARILSEGAVEQVALRGSDVELTIDRNIQYAAEQALAEAVHAHQAEAGVAILMDPSTGEIFAMASYPDFNPNNLRETTVAERTNRAVNAVFEPGSTLKMVTIAAALEEQLIRPETVIDCENGRWRVGRHDIHDARHRYGELTIGEIVQKSSNICAAKVGFRLGRHKLHDWLLRFGFGSPTGVELPGELRGLIRPAGQWSDVGLANIAFGQGISATPMQLVQAAAIIANRGERRSPRLVRAVVRPDGERQEWPPTASATGVLSEATALHLTEMLTAVTADEGTAPAAAIPGFRVAGKTGTAQKIDPVTRAYSHELYVSSFVGFVPADDPKLVGLVLIDEPKGAIYGGKVAAPAWQKMTVAALIARDLTPDDPAAWRAFQAERRPGPHLPPPAQADEVVNGDADFASADESGLADGARIAAAIDLALSEEAQRVLALADSDSASNDQPAEWAEERDGRMPNFAHLTLREVLNRAADTRCDLVVAGTGRVVQQRPPAGRPLAPNARCELTLAPRR